MIYKKYILTFALAAISCMATKSIQLKLVQGSEIAEVSDDDQEIYDLQDAAYVINILRDFQII